MVKVLKEKRRVSFLFTVQMSLGTVFRLVFTRKTGPWIAFALRQAEIGITVEEVCRKLSVSERRFIAGKSSSPGWVVVEIRRLKQRYYERADCLSSAKIIKARLVLVIGILAQQQQRTRASVSSGRL